MQISFKIDAGLMNAMKLFTGYKDARYISMKGIYAFVPDKKNSQDQYECALLATNGHLLAIAKVDGGSSVSDGVDGPPSRWLFPVPDKMAKFDEKKPVELQLGSSASSLIYAGKHGITQIAGVYPFDSGETKSVWTNVWRVVPKELSGEPADFGIRTLSMVTEGFNLAKGKKTSDCGLHIKTNGTKDPSLITADAVKNLVLYVMPIRSEEFVAPEWVKDLSTG